MTYHPNSISVSDFSGLGGFSLGGRVPPAALLPLLLLLPALLHVRGSYLRWTRHFDGDGRRLSRSDRGCPSHKRAPLRHRRRSSVSESLDALRSALLHQPSDFRLSRRATAEEGTAAPPASPVVPSLRRRRSSDKSDKSDPPRRSSSSMSWASDDEPPRFVRPRLSRRDSSFSVAKADELDMDHVRLSFLSFLWGMFFIWPAVAFTGAAGLLWLRLRKWLVGRGLLRPAPFDPERVCYDVCVHSTLAIYFDGFDDDGRATFLFNEFGFINANGEFEVADRLEVLLDVKEGRFVSAAMDGVGSLTASETLNLVYFYLVSGHHVKIHSLANWAVVDADSIERRSREADFVVQNGITTVMYNYFGFSGFGELFPRFRAMGLLSSDPGVSGRTIAEVFRHGIKAGVPEHSGVVEMAPHSPLVDFIVKVRPVFMSEFVKHKRFFPGCGIEALFAGTVLHSLDHTAAAWCVRDPLWFDVDCPRFRLVGEVNRVVSAGFVDDLMGLAFHKSFRGSGHPFYDAVYAKAAAINKEFADSMDTCIIK